MNEEKKFNFTLPENAVKDGKLEILIREVDTTNEVKVRDSFAAIGLTVLLASVSTFISQYAACVLTTVKSLIKYSFNPDALIFEFYENPADKDAAVVKAKLEKHPDLLVWKLNSDTNKITQKEFIQLIRKKGYMLDSPNVAEAMIKKLQTFEVKFETTLKEADDRNGNKESNFKETMRQTEGAIEKEFSLSTPLYVGTEPVRLNIVVELDRGNNNAPVFSFYCNTIEQLLRDEGKRAISAEVEKFKDTYTCVEVQ